MDLDDDGLRREELLEGRPLDGPRQVGYGVVEGDGLGREAVVGRRRAAEREERAAPPRLRELLGLLEARRQ